MFKRILSACICLFLVTSLVLTGCGNKNQQAVTKVNGGTKQQETAEKTTEKKESSQQSKLAHWQHHHEARTPLVKDFITEFAKSNPNVTIEFEPIPFDSYFDKLTTSLASGSGPDVFQINAAMGYEMIKSGNLQPIDESIITNKEIEDNFLKWTVANAYKDGKYYGLPTDVQTLVLFINNELYKKAGFDPSKPPKTWDEFLNQAIKGTIKENGKIVQAGLDTRYKWAVIQLFLYQTIQNKVVDTDNMKVTYDSPEGIKAWNFIHKLMVEEKVDSPTFMSGQMKFELKKAMFYLNHPVTKGRLAKMAPDLEYTVALPPTPNGDNITVGSNWLYVVNKKSANSQTAWKWVQYLTSESSQIKWVKEAGDLPSLKALLEKDELFPTPNDKVARESLEYARPGQELGKTDVDNIRYTIWDSIILNGSNVEEAVKAGKKAEEELIAKKLN